MKLSALVSWLDKTLDLAAFDDVSNNGLQLAREGEDVTTVAFGVDASVAFLEQAAAAGAELCVVHHGISWGGGIRRLTGSDYAVVKTAITRNLAIYGAHLPLDANERVGNNWELARHLGLTDISPAFGYRGNVIGVIGTARTKAQLEKLNAIRPGVFTADLAARLKDENLRVGVCSGGAGEDAVEAKARACDLFVTGEASWQDLVAAENVRMEMVCCGHYETETFGVKALAREMGSALGVKTLFLPRA